MTLTEAFGGLQDPRTGPAQRHDLREMILLALARGTPSHDTFGRVFRILDATIFEQCFRGWMAGLIGVVDGVVALDGKTLCGSRAGDNTALHTISAFATGSGLCLGQAGTRGKGHEIAAIKALLATLTLKGCIVTSGQRGRVQIDFQQHTDLECRCR